ncbi:hypothetical protein ABH931_003196 [Streptacidiphilus sp. MAP12-33]|uniref:hypothetical protein n=1 Tax=Streptacidiphilus sp. MAP12-33 TaxID=3156266 RepID=UPI0035133732
MFEYQFVIGRTNELMAEAEQARLVRDVKRANKARRAGESRSASRRGAVARRLHAAHR